MFYLNKEALSGRGEGCTLEKIPFNGDLGPCLETREREKGGGGGRRGGRETERQRQLQRDRDRYSERHREKE